MGYSFQWGSTIYEADDNAVYFSVAALGFLILFIFIKIAFFPKPKKLTSADILDAYLINTLASGSSITPTAAK